MEPNLYLACDMEGIENPEDPFCWALAGVGDMSFAEWGESGNACVRRERERQRYRRAQHASRKACEPKLGDSLATMEKTAFDFYCQVAPSKFSMVVRQPCYF